MGGGGEDINNTGPARGPINKGDRDCPWCGGIWLPATGWVLCTIPAIISMAITYMMTCRLLTTKDPIDYVAHRQSLGRVCMYYSHYSRHIGICGLSSAASSPLYAMINIGHRQDCHKHEKDPQQTATGRQKCTGFLACRTRQGSISVIINSP